MNATGLVGMLFVTTSLAAPVTAAAAEVLRPLLIVRTYQAAPVGPADWGATMRDATAILDAAGIDVRWIDCSGTAARSRETMPARCNAVMERQEVALRIVRGAGVPFRGEVPLGDSLVDGSRRTGSLATIYIDRVEALARSAGIRVRVLLARAIAHELGHLLLGTSRHSVSGLMRPVWTRTDLVRARPADWMIPAEESALMRQAFADRAELVPTAAARGE